MQTLDVPSKEATRSVFDRTAPSLSTRWFIRRTALWMLCVGLGVAGSCLLYVAVNTAEADADGPSPTTTASLPAKH
jgi:hypothetical protein